MPPSVRWGTADFFWFVATGLHSFRRVEFMMLWLAFFTLLALWVIALATAFTMGGYVHLLLVIALSMLLVESVNHRRV